MVSSKADSAANLAPPAPRSAVSGVALKLLAIALGFAGLTTLFVVIQRVIRYHSELPVLDHWSLFIALAAKQGSFSFTYLWSLHNEHRIFIPKLFYFTDLFLFSARGFFLIWSALLLQLLCAAIFVAVGARDSLSRALLVAVSGLSLVFLFSPVQIENFAWSFQVCFILMGFFSTLSICFFSLHFDRVRSGSPDSRARLYLFGCMAAATGATLTLANGLVLWPLLMIACWLFRLPTSSLFRIGLVGAIEAALYMWGYQTPGHHSRPWETLGRPDLVFAYLLAYIGGPWSVFGLTAAIAAGTIGFSLCGFILWRTVRRRATANSLQLFCVTVFSFETLTGCITSLGRMKFGIAQATTSRYQSFAMLLWLAVGLWFLDAALRSHRGHFTELTLVLAALFCLPGLIRFQQLVAPFESQSQHLHDAELALAAGVADREAMQYLYPDIPEIAPAVLYLKQNRLSIFSHAFPELSLKVQPAGASSGKRCEGSVLTARYIDDLTEPGFRLEGWGWNGQEGKPLSDLSVVDGGGAVIGVGRGGLGIVNGDGPPANLSSRKLAWTAYARSSPAQVSSGMAVVASGGCQIGAPVHPSRGLGYDGEPSPAVRLLSQAHMGIFRNGQWWMDVNGDGRWEMPADKVMTFGQAGDIPVVGDWGKRGTLQIGVFRGGQWWVDVNGDGLWQEGVDKVFIFGQPGDVPVLGDWDNTGKLRIGVFRSGQWWVDIDGDEQWREGIDKVFTFGQAGDLPVVGDWDGAGRLRIGVFRAGQWLMDRNGNNRFDPGVDPVFFFGEAGDRPVVGSWSASGKLRIGVYRHGRWLLDLNGNDRWDGESGDTQVSLGQPGDLPIVGIWTAADAHRSAIRTEQK